MWLHRSEPRELPPLPGVGVAIPGTNYDQDACSHVRFSQIDECTHPPGFIQQFRFTPHFSREDTPRQSRNVSTDGGRFSGQVCALINYPYTLRFHVITRSCLTQSQQIPETNFTCWVPTDPPPPQSLILLSKLQHLSAPRKKGMRHAEVPVGLTCCVQSKVCTFK